MSEKNKPNKAKSLSWWQLTMLGFGFTTGTGYFLGSAIAIQKSGFSVLILFLIAAVGTYFVYDSLARMIAKHTEKGSFRAYSKNAYGRWAGFSHGYIYWSAEMLILGSQLTALGLFTKYWFPQIPLWMFAATFAVLGVLIVLLGTKGVEKTENILAVMKISAIIMFIILALLVFPGVLGQENAHMHSPQQVTDYFKHGPLGMWTALLYVFFAFAGIEVMGLMATELKNPKDAGKSGKVMISVITVLFLVSIGLALLLAPLNQFTPEESPFVTALKDLHFDVIVHIFNGVLIVAGFSSLVASLYSVTLIMQTIAKDGDAPRYFAKRSKKKNLPYTSLMLTICGMIISIVIALLLPKKVYEYITTAGGLMLLYSWIFIVFASRKLLKLTIWGQVKSFAAITLILIAVTGIIFDENSPGFYASLLFVLVIGIITVIMSRKWKKDDQTNDKRQKRRSIPAWKPK
jgi:L-asparagine transporter-like permease